MRSAHITRRQAEAAFDGLDADEDVFALQEEVVMRAERAEIERLIESVELELASERLAESARVRLDGPRSASRARRRSERVALRSLPHRGDVAELVDGEAA
jgi:hypothetical protein